MFLTALSAIAIAVGSSLAVHDVSVHGTQVSQATPVVEVAPIQPVEKTESTGELGW